MRRIVAFVLLVGLGACSDKDSKPSGAGSAATSAPASPAAPAVPTPPAAPATPPSAAPATPPDSGSGSAAAAPSGDGSDEVARMVVHDVGSKAMGNQKIDASCVSVGLFPAGAWTVAVAKLDGCGDKTARSILWLYKRQGNGKWNEDYVGQPPKCWKGLPPDLVEAVTTATKLPAC